MTLLLIFSSFLRKFLSLHLISFISTSVSSLIFNFISLTRDASSSSSYSQSLPWNVFFSLSFSPWGRDIDTHDVRSMSLWRVFRVCSFIPSFLLLFLSLSLSLSLCQTLAYFLLSIQFIVSIDVFLLLPLLSSQVLQLYCFSNSFSLQTLVLSGDDYYLIPRRKQISKSFPAVVSLFLSSPRLSPSLALIPNSSSLSLDLFPVSFLTHVVLNMCTTQEPSSINQRLSQFSLQRKREERR